jgi:hypothetical protein
VGLLPVDTHTHWPVLTYFQKCATQPAQWNNPPTAPSAGGMHTQLQHILVMQIKLLARRLPTTALTTYTIPHPARPPPRKPCNPKPGAGQSEDKYTLKHRVHVQLTKTSQAQAHAKQQMNSQATLFLKSHVQCWVMNVPDLHKSSCAAPRLPNNATHDWPVPPVAQRNAAIVSSSSCSC